MNQSGNTSAPHVCVREETETSRFMGFRSGRWACKGLRVLVSVRFEEKNGGIRESVRA